MSFILLNKVKVLTDIFRCDAVKDISKDSLMGVSISSEFKVCAVLNYYIF